MSTRLYYFNSGIRLFGPNPNLWGDCTNLWGDCTNLMGYCTGLSGDCTGLKGSCSNLSGGCTGLTGDLDILLPPDRRGSHYHDIRSLPFGKLPVNQTVRSNIMTEQEFSELL